MTTMQLSRDVARSVIDTVGGPGEPPQYGFQYFTAGIEDYLHVLDDEYLGACLFSSQTRVRNTTLEGWRAPGGDIGVS